MKLKRLKAAIAALLMSASVVCGMLASGALAAGGIYSPTDAGYAAYLADTGITDRGFTTYIDYLYYINRSLYGYTGTMSDALDNSVLDGNAVKNMYDRYIQNPTHIAQFSITSGSTVYRTTLDGDFFADFYTGDPIMNYGINLGLNFDTSQNGVLIIRGRTNNSTDPAYNRYNGKSLTYTIPYDYVMALLGSAGVSTASGLRLYTVQRDAQGYIIDGSESTIAIKPVSSANLTFTMDDSTFNGLYITAYDKSNYKYFLTEEADVPIKEALIEAFELTDTPDETLNEIAASVKQAISDNYVGKTEIDQYIKDLLFNDDEFRSQITELMLNEKIDIIRKEIYTAFGDTTTEYQAGALMDYVWEKIVKDASSEINNRIGNITASPAKYDTAYMVSVMQDLINFNIDNWASTELASLKTLTDEAIKQYPGMSLVDIIKKLIAANNPDVYNMIKSELESALGFTESQYNAQSVKTYIDKASDSILTTVSQKLSDYTTTTDMESAIRAETADYLANKLDDLIRAYLESPSNYDIIESAVYNAFDENIPETHARKITDYILDHIISEAVLTAQFYPTSDRYRQIDTMLKLYLDGWTDEQLSELETQVNELKGTVEGNTADISDLNTQLENILALINSGILKGEKGDQGIPGTDGTNGQNGQSFSEWAVQNYGSVEGFIASIVSQVMRNVRDGASAYEIAVKNGYRGTEQEWLNSLAGASAYDIAVRNGFRGSEADWLESLRGEDGIDGVDGRDGKDGKDGRDGQDGQIVYMNGYSPNNSYVLNGSDYSDPDDAEEIYILNDGEAVASVTQGANSANRTPNAVAGATDSNSRPVNPSTGVAAGIIIPAAAIGSVLLIKKDKRKRGRK